MEEPIKRDNYLPLIRAMIESLEEAEKKKDLDDYAKTLADLLGMVCQAYIEDQDINSKLKTTKRKNNGTKGIILGSIDSQAPR